MEDIDQDTQAVSSESQQLPVFYPSQGPQYEVVETPKPTVIRQDVSSPVPLVFAGVCVIGIIILGLGALMAASAFLHDFDYSQSADVRTYGRMGIIFGGMLLSVGLLAAGLAAEGLSSRNRSTLYIAAVIAMFVTILWPYY